MFTSCLWTKHIVGDVASLAYVFVIAVVFCVSVKHLICNLVLFYVFNCGLFGSGELFDTII